MARRVVRLALIILSLLLVSCENGLSPESTPVSTGKSYGIRGVIHFLHWPPQDSVVDLRLAILQDTTIKNLLNDVLQGKARYTDKIPYGIDSEQYTLALQPLAPGTFPFVGVAQQYGPDVQKDWKVVGLYYANHDSSTPGSVVVPPDSVVPGINITVDFSHPPVLP
jgi:hypothetical protein